MSTRAAWRWANVPLPEPHLVGLGTGLLLQLVAPWRLPWPAWVGRAVGVPLLLAGIALAADAAWPLLLLPAVLLATHLVVVREERSLEARFGAGYRSYRASVRRYL
jgi:protein-S-isoprenylcysteine O-methyltransferase Ste14